MVSIAAHVLLASRVLLDAHNCYPEQGRWPDRIERALTQGLPIAIEQDLAWFNGKSILTHEKETNGAEPGMREHFFERIRPVVERELQSGDRQHWPVIVLNLDFKTDEPEHHRAVWQLLGEYESWLSTARKDAAHPETPGPLDRKPVLVLTGLNQEQERTFHDAVPDGARLRVFGAVMDGAKGTARATNYRRWSNNAWNVVEPEGQIRAGDWTSDDQARLRKLVDEAHARGLWIRFYTLNGHAPEATRANGWTASYNFGSLAAARLRWRAAIEAGVDFVATDQYEDFARELAAYPAPATSAARPGDALHDTMARLDREMFDAYNRCDADRFAALFDPAVEFYHDQGGLMVGVAELVRALKANICGKVRRELVAGTLEVHPMKGYGALVNGYHRFHPSAAGAAPTGVARFSHLWKQTGGEWKVTRVLSFDHVGLRQP